jgi:hypothetical protein
MALIVHKLCSSKFDGDHIAHTRNAIVASEMLPQGLTHSALMRVENCRSILTAVTLILRDRREVGQERACKALSS